MTEVTFHAELNKLYVDFISDFHRYHRAYECFLKVLFTDKTGVELLTPLGSIQVSSDHVILDYTRHFTMLIEDDSGLIPKLKHSMAVARGEGRYDHKVSLLFKAVPHNWKNVEVEGLLLTSMRNSLTDGVTDQQVGGIPKR